MTEWRLQYFIIISLEIDLNILKHFITLQASQAVKFKFSFSIIKNISWNSLQCMINNDQNVDSQNNNDNTSFLTDINSVI